MTDDINTLSNDLGLHILFIEADISNSALVQGSMRWGEDMFGSETILGGAIEGSYQSGTLNIRLLDDRLNIARVE